MRVFTEYPRHDQSLAPKMLAEFLGERVPTSLLGAGDSVANSGGLRFCDLDSRVWGFLATEACEELALRIVSIVDQRLSGIRRRLAQRKIADSGQAILLGSLQIGFVTFSRLSDTCKGREKTNLAKLSVGDVLDIPGFEPRCLVDLLSAVETAKYSREFSPAGSVDEQLISPAEAGEDLGTRDVGARLVPPNLERIISNEGGLPETLVHCVFPRPKHGIRLKDMGLARRTFNCLRRKGFDRDPTLIGNLSMADALEFSGFGVGSLVDLVRACYRCTDIEGAICADRREETKGPAIGARSQRETCLETRGLLKVLVDCEARGTEPPHSLLQQFLPTLPDGTNYDDLHLNKRTYNALVRAELASDPAVLSKHTLDEVFGLRGMGITSLMDLLAWIGAVRESAGHFEENPRNKARIAVCRHDGRTTSAPTEAMKKSGDERAGAGIVPADLRAIVAERGEVPPVLEGCVFPTPDLGIRLTDMDLDVRTFNCLCREGYERDPTRVGQLTVWEALRIRGFGIACVFDLVEASHRCSSVPVSATAGVSVSEEWRGASSDSDRQVCRKTRGLIRKVRTCVKRGADLPGQLLREVLPLLPPGTTFAELDLKRRTYNALYRGNMGRDPVALCQHTIAEIVGLAGFGVTCLVDLLEQIRDARERHGFFAEPPRTSRRSRDKRAAARARAQVPSDLGIVFEKQGKIPRDFLDYCLPPVPVGTTIADLRLNKRASALLAREGFAVDVSRTASLTLREILRIPYFGPRDAVELVEKLHLLSKEKPVQGRVRKALAEDEIVAVIVPSGDKRRVDVLREYLGLLGAGNATFDSIAQRLGLTRERVRQICTPRYLQKDAPPPPAPSLDECIDFVVASAPCGAREIEVGLREKELIGIRTELESLFRGARLLRRSLKVAVWGTGECRIVVGESHVSEIKTIQKQAQRRVSREGVANLSQIGSDVFESHGVRRESAYFLAVICACEGFRWLNQRSGWFWLDDRKANLLVDRIRKVLSVAPRITANDLRGALRRDFRIGTKIPPVDILKNLCEQLSFCDVSREEIVSKDVADTLPMIRGDERVLVSILLEHGPICRRDELWELAQSRGMSKPSFWRQLCHSITVFRYATGVFGLVGADATPGLIQSLDKSPDKRKILIDHGWTTDGSVWIAYRLSKPVLEAGVVGIPSAKQRLLQGRFTLHSLDGTSEGTLVLKDHSCWGFGPFLRKSTAERGDIMVMRVNLGEMTATLAVGDETLLEEITVEAREEETTE